MKNNKKKSNLLKILDKFHKSNLKAVNGKDGLTSISISTYIDGKEQKVYEVKKGDKQ